jgi:hypothetical protein
MKALEALRAAAPFEPENATMGAPDMTLLRPERGAAPELPLAAVFGPVWGQWIAEAADAKGAPPDYVAAALLAVSGSLIGNARWVAPWAGWAEPPVLWAALIGAPSAGKSPALDAALAPLRAMERRLRRDAERDRAAWAEKDEAAKLALAAWKTEATKALKEGDDPPPKPKAADAGPEPHIPRLAVNDATVERLAVILAKQPRGTLAVRDELAGWLANMSRYANGGSDKPFWLEAYGGRAFTVERMSREPVRVESLTVAALGGIQPDRLASLLIKADDDGMLARLVPVWPEPAPVKRPEVAPDEAFAEEAFARLYGLAMPMEKRASRDRGSFPSPNRRVPSSTTSAAGSGRKRAARRASCNPSSASFRALPRGSRSSSRISIGRRPPAPIRPTK